MLTLAFALANRASFQHVATGVGQG